MHKYCSNRDILKCTTIQFCAINNSTYFLLILIYLIIVVILFVVVVIVFALYSFCVVCPLLLV
jgi:hypothetical protein